jgi:Ca2+-binding EF-hand superfamily protein
VSRAAFSALVVLILAVACSAADPPKVSTRADSLDLLLIGSEKPSRLELRVDIDGKSVPAVWDETFAKLFAFCDRNGDGALDKVEAARLPSPFAVRQVLWGQFATVSGNAPSWNVLDPNGDGKVAADELADFYRRSGLGGVLVGVGKPPSTDQLTDALLKHLDTNKDGKVDEAEWKAAPAVLRKLDKNDDELIGPGELVDRAAYPGALGSALLGVPTPDANPDAVTDALPLTVLPLRTNDTRWANVVAIRRGKEKLPTATADALLALRKADPATAWQVRFGAGKAPTLEPVGGKPPANARLSLASGPLRVEFRADGGKLAEQLAAARKRFLAAFTEFDLDADGTLDDKELGATKATQFQSLRAFADSNGDGKLDRKELAAWLDLQEQIAKGHVLLTILDHGAGLFELLDADHDGSLSVRELRTAWDRLKASSCIIDGKFGREKLPRHLIATVSHGHPQHPLGKTVRGGPEWFLAMDRNGDGDVSRREFTGPADVFDRFDLDKDDLLSAEEAGKTRK